MMTTALGPRLHGTLNQLDSLHRPLNVKMLKETLRRIRVGGLLG